MIKVNSPSLCVFCCFSRFIPGPQLFCVLLKFLRGVLGLLLLFCFVAVAVAVVVVSVFCSGWLFD